MVAVAPTMERNSTSCIRRSCKLDLRRDLNQVLIFRICK